jgi:hypothetical protein
VEEERGGVIGEWGEGNMRESEQAVGGKGEEDVDFPFSVILMPVGCPSAMATYPSLYKNYLRN